MRTGLITVCYRVVVLPELYAEGDLPPGVHVADGQPSPP